ncbi:23S rRNA (pseudouridine(1915)-N(3))-methyltransferase RlmH [Candidatus Woesearchaeota archaeon]|nr:23S rRNA (pseudouridine(1915)-N(3))-methyltransferase RlmH [Candidatus Woesearchaeota archaeon]
MITILAVGRLKDSRISALTEEFLVRVNRFYRVEIQEAKDNESLLKRLDKSSAFIVSCDERGKEFSSVEFSQFISQKSLGGDILFVIGDENGLPEEIKKKSHLLLAFSRMTFLHEMARLFLAEQLYRAFTIMKGMEYHK